MRIRRQESADRIQESKNMEYGAQMEHIAVIDFGSQYTQLIIRRIRELGIFSKIYLPDTFKIMPEMKGIILSGGPRSVFERNAPKINLEQLDENIPTLGICYGMQLLAHLRKEKVLKTGKSEYGRATINVAKKSKLFDGLPKRFKVWMSHSDSVFISEHNGLAKTSRSDSDILSSFEHKTKPIYAIQFHPEVHHTDFGQKILGNFLFNICKMKKNWNDSNFIHRTIQEIKNQVGNDMCICATSGGVDSTTAAVLAHKALGMKLKCVFVDNGFLRKNEFTTIKSMLRELGLNLYAIDASKIFLRKLKKVVDPEKKRKIIGAAFIDVFDDFVKDRFTGCKYLIQGTLYPDVIESQSPFGSVSATIKTHHNVGGLPEKLGFEIIEPFRFLFKDEVRKISKKLGLSPDFINRQPFPGPGLAVRIIGEITMDRIRILQEADAITTKIIESSKVSESLWQYFAVLLPIRSVGVEGDERKYKYVLAIRAVTSLDAMTADWARLPHPVLQELSEQITNNVPEIGRVVYDITTKPPSTIEWE